MSKHVFVSVFATFGHGITPTSPQYPAYLTELKEKGSNPCKVHFIEDNSVAWLRFNQIKRIADTNTDKAGLKVFREYQTRAAVRAAEEAAVKRTRAVTFTDCGGSLARSAVPKRDLPIPVAAWGYERYRTEKDVKDKTVSIAYLVGENEKGGFEYTHYAAEDEEKPPLKKTKQATPRKKAAETKPANICSRRSGRGRRQI